MMIIHRATWVDPKTGSTIPRVIHRSIGPPTIRLINCPVLSTLVFLEHPLIRPNIIQERDYQQALADACLRSSTLVVLPTGMGKDRRRPHRDREGVESEEGKGPVPCTDQTTGRAACQVLERELGRKKSGGTYREEIEPEEREVEWLQNDVIASTPQVVANDIRSERITLRDVKLIIFDEAHRGVGNYAYVPIAEDFRGTNGLVMGMTASPGASMAKIKEVCGNLGIENIEVRSESDPDVSKYLHDIQMDWVEVEVPVQMRQVTDVLRSLQHKYVKELISMGVMTSARPATVKYLLEVRQAIENRLRSGEKSNTLYRALSVQAMVIKVGHALELGETQGLTALTSYLEKLKEEAASDDDPRPPERSLHHQSSRTLLRRSLRCGWSTPRYPG